MGSSDRTLGVHLTAHSLRSFAAGDAGRSEFYKKIFMPEETGALVFSPGAGNSRSRKHPYSRRRRAPRGW